MSWTLTKKLEAFAGPGEIKRREVVLDPEVSPEEIKSREVVLDPQVSPEEIKSREVELGLRVALLSLQLFPNGGATDIVFVTLICIAVGTAIAWCGSCCAMPDGHCLNIFVCSGGGPRQSWSSGLAPKEGCRKPVLGVCFEASPFIRLYGQRLCQPPLFVPVPNYRPPRLCGR